MRRKIILSVVALVSLVLVALSINLVLGNLGDPPSTPTSLTCDGEPCENDNAFVDNIVIQCSGSVDGEGDDVIYSIDALYDAEGPVGGWWDTDWRKRKKMNIEGGDAELTNFTVFIIVQYDGNMQADFDDIRFLGNGGVEELSFEKIDFVSGVSAQFFVRIPLLAMGVKNIACPNVESTTEAIPVGMQ